MKSHEHATTIPRNNWHSSALGIAIAILAVATITGILHTRAALNEDPGSRTPLPVATTSFLIQDSYTRPVSHLGLVVAGRKATLGFEIPGQIASLPLREGSPVKRGQAIAVLDDATLLSRRSATAADLEQARAELELARLKARRQEELSKTGAVSKEAFDETRLRARALASRVEAVTARLEGIDIELQKSRLIAPYDGVVAERYVYQGEVVSPGTPVVRLIELADQEAHIGVAASRAGTLSAGQDHALKLREHSFDARLLTIRPDVDPVTRTTTLIFALPSAIEALDGEPVTLELEESVQMTGGWLPIAALLEGQRGLWTVLRLEAEGTEFRTVRESVEVLDIQGNRAYVHGTLPDGAEVVASGVHRIAPGTTVALKEKH